MQKQSRYDRYQPSDPSEPESFTSLSKRTKIWTRVSVSLAQIVAIHVRFTSVSLSPVPNPVLMGYKIFLCLLCGSPVAAQPVVLDVTDLLLCCEVTLPFGRTVTVAYKAAGPQGH